MLFAHAAEEAGEDCLVDRLPLPIEERVVSALAPHEVEHAPILVGHHPADSEIGHLVNVCVGGALGNPVKESGDGAKGGALTGLVPAVDHLDTAGSQIDLDVGEGAERQQTQLQEPHKRGSLERSRGMSISSTSPRSVRR